MPRQNLFSSASHPARGEIVETLLETPTVTIERILSSAAIEPTHYRQSHDEWVVLLRGRATLIVDGRKAELGSGDYLHLPRQTPHTLVRASQDALWLAVHMRDAKPPTPDSDALR